MNRLLILMHMIIKCPGIVVVIFLTTGCINAAVTKNFRITTDPPDAIIKVIAADGHEERKYTSPAVIATAVPVNPALAAKTVLEITRDRFRPTIISLQQINNGDSIRVTLEKHSMDQKHGRQPAQLSAGESTYQLKYCLLRPTLSDELLFRDQAIRILFVVHEQAFQMNLANLSPYPLKILWDRAEYIDVYAQRRRLMHSGIRYQDRNNPIPHQIVLPGDSTQEAITPIEHVYVSPRTRGYEVKSLFNRRSDITVELVGKTFNLFIPIEINRTIILYNFKIGITDVVKVTVKD